MNPLVRYFDNMYPEIPQQDIAEHLDKPENQDLALQHLNDTHYAGEPIKDINILQSKTTPQIPINLSFDEPEKLPLPEYPKILSEKDFIGFGKSEGASYQAYKNYKSGVDRWQKEYGNNKDALKNMIDIENQQFLSAKKDNQNRSFENYSKEDKTKKDRLWSMEQYYRPDGDYEWFVPSDKNIKLTQGRYNLGKINTAFVDNVLAASKKAGIDPLDVLAIAGRESTFGQEYGKSQQARENNTYQMLFSQWQQGRNKAMGDTPLKNHLEFLYEKGIKGIEKKITKVGYEYRVKPSVSNEEIEAQIEPKMLFEYETILKNKLKSAPLNSLERTIKMIKENKLSSYNPGDKDYPNKIAHEKQLLLKEKALMDYINKK